MVEITRECISLPERKLDAHKGDFGRVILYCGSCKYTGAAYFAASAAVCTGSGLVFLSIPRKIRPVLAAKLNEPILISRRERMRGDACLVGCGLGLSGGAKRLARELIGSPGSPLVVDADAITAASEDATVIKNSKRELVLTPHFGEFSRLVPDFAPERREEFASNFARQNGCVLVLKGHRTITASPDGKIFINTTGNPGMAKGGSGDILAGIITSLLGQGIPPLRAAYTGVWLHGAAGDLARDSFGEYAMTPTDMLCTLKTVLKGVQ